jgi:tRNA pseudouridine13 synthase
MEARLGIVLFLTQGPWIGGKVKSTETDFKVQEIDLQGKTSELTNEVFIKIEPEVKPSYFLSNETFDALVSGLGQTSADLLKDLFERIRAGDREAIIEIPCPELKEDRGKIHFLIKKLTPELTTSTEVEKNVIKVYSSQLAHSFNKRQKLGLDSRGAKKREAPFVKFLMMKKGFDTMKALKILAKCSGVKEKSFGIAGIKDKCAVTTQNVTVFANYLEKLQSCKPPAGISIGNFQFTDQALKIGDLKGNFFDIIIREVNPEAENLLSGLSSTIKSSGFINYFGTQRFGNSSSNPTHKIGLFILKKDYESAVNSILAPRSSKNPEEEKARRNWNEFKDLKKALEEFPHFCVRLISILKELCLLECRMRGVTLLFLMESWPCLVILGCCMDMLISLSFGIRL